MDDIQLDPPKLVIHALCGEPIFYYFGSNEEAKILRNFNDISTLEGDAITPEDIISCAHCGETIKINQLQVVVHQVKTIDIFKIPQKLDDAYKKYIELQEALKYNEQQKIRALENKLWLGINDTLGIYKPEKK